MDFTSWLGGTIAGRYRLEEVLSVDAHEVIFRASWPSHARMVEFRMMDVGRDPILRQRLLRELKITAALSHPHIQRIHDADALHFEHDDPLIYLVAEHLPGPTLEQILTETPRLSVARAIGLMRQILAALEAAHGYGILCRHLDPSTVKVITDRHGGAHVKLLGFTPSGERLAKQSTSSMPDYDVVTAYYMPPEQVMAPQSGPWTDVQAAGALLYRMLTGGPPTPSGQPANASPPRPRDDLPAPILRVIERSMASDRVARWPTPMSFWRALQTAISRAEGRATE